jgi:hypothetical protein
MERALSLESLGEALGDHPAEVSSLPTVEELQALMADTEVRLFTGRAAISEDLLQAGWYLHGVASAPAQFELYDEPRQRRAFQISAHIFDLALAEDRWNQTEQFRLAFAAEIGYHRGELQPNAMAIWRRVEALVSSPGVLDHSSTVALEAGTAFLGQDRRRVMDVVRGWRAAFRVLRRQLELQSLDETMFAAPNAVVDAVDGLMQYLAFGNTRALGRARERLQYAVDSRDCFGGLDARWVAAHLLAVSGQMERGSIWSLLPPELPSAAHQALTLTDPPVLALWEPQRELLTAQPRPLDAATRRVVMSVPTSAGRLFLLNSSWLVISQRTRIRCVTSHQCEVSVVRCGVQ